MAAAAFQQWWSHDQPTATWTSSTCTPKTTARGTHVFRVLGYSQHKGVGANRFIRSATFFVGGFRWSIRYYPDGTTTSAPPGRLVLHLELMSKNSAVRASFDFRLLHHQHHQPTTTAAAAAGKNNAAAANSTPFYLPWTTTAPPIASFSTLKQKHGEVVVRWHGSSCSWGIFCDKEEREVLEACACLRDDDCLVIQCDVTVLGKPRVHDVVAPPPPRVRVPPSDLSGDLARLLQGRKGADVTFRVGDELFPAHRAVLAMRSPVFDAQFYGPMREEHGDDDVVAVVVEDMQPAVFRALLHFMYTDAMAACMEEGLDDGDRKEMVKHLLVAADRYAVDRLKLICEGALCGSLEDEEDAANTLALADAHHCHGLKKACVAFLAKLDRERVGRGAVAGARQDVVSLRRHNGPRRVSSRLKKVGGWMLSCHRPTPAR